VENPDIRVLAELRKALAEEVDELKAVIARLEERIEALDETIGKGSFTTADVALAAASRPPTPTPAETITESGTPEVITVMNKERNLELATIEVIDQTLRIIPAEHAIYDIKRGAFARFFVDRILGNFQAEDKEKAEAKEIDWNDTFDFEINADDSILEEVIIHNYGTEARLNEIERALRWALEKTYAAR
jgi:hypothetical protein